MCALFDYSSLNLNAATGGLTGTNIEIDVDINLIESFWLFDLLFQILGSVQLLPQVSLVLEICVEILDNISPIRIKHSVNLL